MYSFYLVILVLLFCVLLHLPPPPPPPLPTPYNPPELMANQCEQGTGEAGSREDRYESQVDILIKVTGAGR